MQYFHFLLYSVGTLIKTERGRHWHGVWKLYWKAIEKKGVKGGCFYWKGSDRHALKHSCYFSSQINGLNDRLIGKGVRKSSLGVSDKGKIARKGWWKERKLIRLIDWALCSQFSPSYTRTIFMYTSIVSTYLFRQNDPKFWSYAQRGQGPQKFLLDFFPPCLKTFLSLALIPNSLAPQRLFSIYLSICAFYCTQLWLLTALAHNITVSYFIGLIRLWHLTISSLEARTYDIRRVVDFRVEKRTSLPR